MRGSENNDMWAPGDDVPELEGQNWRCGRGPRRQIDRGPLRVLVHFKPPSSLPGSITLHLPSNKKQSLKVGGRHDPVIGREQHLLSGGGNAVADRNCRRIPLARLTFRYC